MFDHGNNLINDIVKKLRKIQNISQNERDNLQAQTEKVYFKFAGGLLLSVSGKAIKFDNKNFYFKNLTQAS